MKPRRTRGVYVTAAVALTTLVVVGLTLVWSPSGSNGRSGGANPATTAVTGGLATQKLPPTGDVWAFSNPTDDGRYMAGMVEQTGDVALVDVATGTYRTLGLGRGDYSDGYASLGIISPDGSVVAVEWWHDNVGTLKLIGTDGGGRRDLVPAPAEVRAYQFSRDGTLILAAVRLDRDTNAICLIAVADGAVRQIRTIGRVLPVHMSLSPDGRYIAYDYPESAGTIERDIFILDAHTNTQWPLAAAPGEDRSAYWTPDGKSIVFLSDRSRTLSLWATPVTQGHASGEAQLIKDDMGRSWLSGFTASGRLFYVQASGHAEVYIASLNDARMKPQVITPRLALSNFYPEWSQDGRYVAYSSERSNNGREIWVYDTQLQKDERITALESKVGRPFGWSPDGSWLLTRGTEEQQLYLVNRATGSIKVIAENAVRASWGPSGILYRRGKLAELYDAASGRVSRSLDYRDPSFAGFEAAWDGRSVIAVRKDGNISIEEISNRRRYEWQDSGVSSIGNHFMAPHAMGVAYVATRPSTSGPVKTLMYWGGAGPPRELLRGSPTDDFILAGWHGDGRQLLLTRMNPRPETELRNETLWRVPIDGSGAISTGLTMEGLRDISIHPDGHQIAFNAGWKKNEHWVMDNLLPK